MSLSINSVQELSPEELEPLKDALLAHLRSQNAGARDQVDRDLHVTRGERVPVYAFTLQSLLETRDSVPTSVVKPCSPDLAKTLPRPDGTSGPGSVPPATLDLWSFPSEERADFTPHADTYLLAGTLREEECHDCYHKGETGCKPCMGKGLESCPVCLGAGNQSCVFCRGTEKISCLRCGGEGRLSSGEVGGRSARCDACGSTGKFHCTHCKGGKVSCSQCRGAGTAPCQKCKGQGKIVCGTCAGHKKIVSGKAFHASFKPFQTRAVCLAGNGPAEAMDMALEKVTGAGSAALTVEEPLERPFEGTTIPPSILNALGDLAAREKAQTGPATRVVKRRLDVSEGQVVRISGYCAGQEFSFWISPSSKRIFAEKDPMAVFGKTAAISAEDAREAGDWKKALSLARESLLYSPAQPGARGIFWAWRRKVAWESVLVGVGGGTFAALAHAFHIAHFEKGLHKLGPILQIGGTCLGLGVVTGLALVPVLLRVGQAYFRYAILVVGLLGVFSFHAARRRWSGEADPVRAADQAALDQELNEHFKYGMTRVYYEQDLRFLQALLNKYKDTRVDLTRIREGLASQVALRDRLAIEQEEFEGKVRAIAGSEDSLGRKKTQLTKWINYYRPMGVDVKLGQSALEDIEKGTRQNASRFRSSPGRMSIISSGYPVSPRGSSSWTGKPAPPSGKKTKSAAAKPLSKKAETKRSSLKSGESKRWWE